MIDDVVQWLKVVDTFAILGIIFLTGAAFQRLKNLEEFIKNHKAFHDKVIRNEERICELAADIAELKADVRQLGERIINRL